MKLELKEITKEQFDEISNREENEEWHVCGEEYQEQTTLIESSKTN